MWWAVSDDVPGFSAAADHLPELVTQATAALREIEGDDVEVVQEVVFDEVAIHPEPVAADTEPERTVRQKIVSSPALETV